MAQAVRSSVKAIFRRIYFKLAAPLWRKMAAQLESHESVECSARAKLESETRELRDDVRRLESIIQMQGAYIDELVKTGLHEMVAQYTVTKLRSPGVVANAIVDVMNGMEPANAAQIHNISADEIIGLFRLLSNQAVSKTASEQKNNVLTPQSTGSERHDIDLLEAQLQFNAMNHLDREHASSLEIVRLKNELTLEQLHRGRVVAGQ